MYVSDKKIKGTMNNLSDYKTIIGDKGTKIFNPEKWEAMQLQETSSITNMKNNCHHYDY